MGTALVPRTRPVTADPLLDLFLAVAWAARDVRTIMRACSWCCIILDGTPTPRFERAVFE